MFKHLWPRSLQGQVLLAIALALLFAQGLSSVLLYRAQHERLESTMLHSVAFRLVAAYRTDIGRLRMPPPPPGAMGPRAMSGFRIERLAASPQRAGENRLRDDESELGDILAGQDVPAAELVVLRRDVRLDPRSLSRLSRQNPGRHHAFDPDEVLIAAVRIKGSSGWLVARTFVPQNERIMLGTIFAQTLFIYAVMVGAMWLLLRRITRPLAALTSRLARFADTRDAGHQLVPQGPDDIRHLISAHNGMEARIAALLDEKDVMLGAIGHDLKTPLAALRVRIESVEDETERARMARTIEDITRTLDDILSLARVGRPSDRPETAELSALVASVVEEFEDMGEPVELGECQRMALAVRSTWLRRALRNLISNGVRYGKRARVSLQREEGAVLLRVSDDGPGIAGDQIARMLEPFTRGEPSRNTATGGAGLGLTLARAIAEQHGGTLELVNRRDADGAVAGLDAVLRLPL